MSGGGNFFAKRPFFPKLSWILWFEAYCAVASYGAFSVLRNSDKVRKWAKNERIPWDLGKILVVIGLIR